MCPLWRGSSVGANEARFSHQLIQERLTLPISALTSISELRPAHFGRAGRAGRGGDEWVRRRFDVAPVGRSLAELAAQNSSVSAKRVRPLH